MGAQAAQASWQLPTLPPDTVGGTEPGETGKENTKEGEGRGVTSLSATSPGGRGIARPGGKALARPWSWWQSWGQCWGQGTLLVGQGC